MEIATTFTILLPADEAYRFLLDLEQVAPCVPGGELGPAAADGTYPANVTVRLGPMRLGYSGSLWIAEQDDSRRRAVLRAKATETRAQGSLEAAMTMNVSANGDASRVRVHTELAPARGRSPRSARRSRTTTTPRSSTASAAPSERLRRSCRRLRTSC